MLAGEKYKAFSKLCAASRDKVTKAREAKEVARREQSKRVHAKATKSTVPSGKKKAVGFHAGGAQQGSSREPPVDFDPDLGVSEALALVDLDSKQDRINASREAQQNDLEQERRFKQPVYYGRCTLFPPPLPIPPHTV
jgi:hypothetical protein